MSDTNASSGHENPAPNAGRQSPDPERQTGAQQQKPPATDVNEQGMAENDQAPKDESADQLKSLDSNPKHVLQDEADAKVGKEQAGK